MIEHPLIILLLSAIFGFVLKIADLLNEHGLKLFKGANILFGILWGIIGALLILSNNLIAVFFIALLFHWILRYRIDYLNHGIGTVIILITFLYNLNNFSMNWTVFLMIFISYSIFGLINDAADRGEIKGKIGKFLKLNFPYIIFPAILILINTNYWIILGCSALHLLFYNLAYRCGTKLIKRQKK